ncbi:MAG: VC0807 family protein [Actinocatenispora sp.]
MKRQAAETATIERARAADPRVIPDPSHGDRGAPSAADRDAIPVRAEEEPASGSRSRRTVVLGILWDVLPATVGYFVLRAAGVGTEYALLGATGVAALRLAWVAVRARQFDAIAGFLLAIYGLSAAGSLMGGGQHALLLRDSLTTGVLAGGMLVSVALRRPLVFLAAKRVTSPVAGADWDHRWATEPEVRHTFTVLTLGWGIGLLAEALARVPLIYLIRPDVMVGLSSVMQALTTLALIVWSVRYVRRRRAADGSGSTPVA